MAAVLLLLLLLLLLVVVVAVVVVVVAVAVAGFCSKLIRIVFVDALMAVLFCYLYESLLITTTISSRRCDYCFCHDCHHCWYLLSFMLSQTLS